MIDNEKYVLSNKNFFEKEFKKNKIIMGSTFSKNMNHFIGWEKRYNGNNKKTASFTINFNGEIFQHFNPKYYSSFTGIDTIDKESISIILENEGYLFKLNENNKYVDWFGDIYNREDIVFEKKWRNYNYWAPYTTEQLESTIKLCNSLCNQFNIKMVSTPNNVKIDDLNEFNGVLYKSNLYKHFTDLNPSWDFSEFKNKLELINEKNEQ